MKIFSLEPFVPSGSKFTESIQFFQDLGFNLNWNAGDYVGFEKDGCRFILQKYDNMEFAQNYMISVKIDNAEKFWQEVTQKDLTGKYGIKLSKPTPMPYGVEVNIIDIAGVCWHFVQ